MHIRGREMKVALVVVGALLICGLGSFLGTYVSRGGGGGNIVAEVGDMFSLSTPAFAQGADPSTAFLEEEAGMSIYTDLAQSLSLATAKTVYKTIEKETTNYTVGSVSLPGLPETDDVHIFVQKDGWIVVYYLKAEPASKVIDWNYYSGGKLTKTKLQVGLEQMCSALGVTATDIKYYHFQYPYASKWMVIIDNDSFNLKIPSEFTVYERSWSHRSISSGTATVVNYGQLTASQLSPDTFHTLAVQSSSYYSIFLIDGNIIEDQPNAYTPSGNIAVILLYKES